VNVFLAQFPDLPPATAAGLARLLHTVRQLPRADTERDAAQASWARLTAQMDGQRDPIPPALPAETVESGRIRSAGAIHDLGRIHTHPAPRAASAGSLPLDGRWRLAPTLARLAVASVLLAAGATVLFSQVAPDAGRPRLPVVSSDNNGQEAARSYTPAIHPLSADPNLVVLGITAADAALSPEQNRAWRWEGGNVRLTAATGVALPNLQTEIGWTWQPDGQADTALVGTRIWFDAAPLQTSAATLDLHLVMDLQPEPALSGGYPAGPGGSIPPTPVPTQPPPLGHAPQPIHIDRTIQVPFDARRRILEPHERVETRGVALTLDRIVVTAAETRLFLKIPAGTRLGDLRLSGAGWSAPNGAGSYTAGLRQDGDGDYVIRVGGALLDKPGPWTLTFGPVSQSEPGGLPNYDKPPLGPWVFNFTLPLATTSLTPGAVPPQPSPWPTSLPNALPTIIKPLSGPVPPTTTAEPAPRLTPTSVPPASK
jgi:hypothetical protein